MSSPTGSFCLSLLRPGTTLAPLSGAMRTSSRRTAQAGFTLIELLTVIAIIGILAAIFIPTIGAVREKAQRAVDSNNLREIAKAAMIYAADNNDRLPGVNISPSTFRPTGNTLSTTDYLWAAALAKSGGITDPAMYYSKTDPYFPQSIPAAILDPSSTGNPTLNSDFAASDLSIEVVGGLRMSDPATSPIAFTRGLGTNGLWSIEKGAYKDDGGFIAFLGGNVVYYKDLQGDNQLTASNGRKTSNILQALPYRGADAATNRNPRVYSSSVYAGVGTQAGTASVTPPTN